MKVLLVISALAMVSLAAETENSAEHKKRGAPKSPAINSLSSNGHQKPESINYVSYQPSNTATHPPLYPLAPQNYQVEQPQHLQQSQQQAFNFLPPHPQPQLLPLQLYPQMTVAPKFQLISAKQANGHTQLMLIPQGLFFNAQSFAQPSYLQPQQTLLANHPQLSLSGQTPTASHLSAPSQNNYVTPQPLSYTTQPASHNQPQTNYFSQPQASLGFNQHSSIAQPSTMFLYNQPAPQLYNNYANQQSNNGLYTQAGQQLLNYYQTNPQAKYQLLYGNSQQSPSQTNYQSPPVSSPEFEKTVAGPIQQSLSTQKSDSLGLNTNEFISPPDTHFRPIPSYGTRGSSATNSYKN